MRRYSEAAWERAMKVQEVILRAMAKRISWWQAAEIIGISDRSLRRWKRRYEKQGFDGLFDRRRGKPSPRQVSMAQAEEVLRLYQEKYADLNVRHFHEKLGEVHGIKLSYTWVKLALQGAGLVKKGRKRGVHRKRRPRRPLPGMLLHLDGSRHRWFQDDRWYDLIEVLDDATSETYYAQLVESESTRTVMAALREVIERRGRFCALYSDRASPFLRDAQGGRAGRPAAADASGTGFEGAGDSDDPGLFAAGAGPGRAAVRHLARTLTAGAALGWDHELGRSELLHAGAIHSGDEPEVCGAGAGVGTRFCAGVRPGPGPHLFRAAGARGGQRQHGADGRAGMAARAHPVARDAGGLSGDDLRASGWSGEHRLRAAPGGAVHGGRSAAEASEKKARATLWK
jgi:transposase